MSLEDDPFDWTVTHAGQVRVFRGGRLVVVVAGTAADRLSAQLETASPEQAQQLLARATGNYRRGNERRPHR